VLGAPFLSDSSNNPLLDADGNRVAGSVIFTSYDDQSVGFDTNPVQTTPGAGDWGGIEFRNDIDRSEGRFSLERQGIFLSYVNHADIRYGGGEVSIDSETRVVNPIHMIDTRPTISFNTITNSADAAMSAAPNSFEETNFNAPPFQFIEEFTADYDRVGPDLHANRLLDNSTNALFVRIETPVGDALQPMTVAGRFDDTDIVHVVAENLDLQGTPSGAFRELSRPPIALITVDPFIDPGGTLNTFSQYSYRLVYVDAAGYEGLESNATTPIVPNAIVPTASAIVIGNLPPANGRFVARHLYRSENGGDFTLIAELDGDDTTYTDYGTALGGTLTLKTRLDRPRTDARLTIDPGTVVKLEGAKIETDIGAQLIAEGTSGYDVIFTSRLDDRFGAGGTFDTNNDNDQASGENQPNAGDWAGIYAGPFSTLSIDHALITFGGGITDLGGTFAGFNAVEIHQAEARIANSTLENNASGRGGQAGANRDGHTFNEAAVIFVRGSQPVIVNNVIRDNRDTDANTTIAAININVNSLSAEEGIDYGRSRGPVDDFDEFVNNRGPLVRLNRLGGNEMNGMQIRGETLNTESVWDDTDIVHVLVDESVYVPDFHTFGGLRLKSSPGESLVVKFSGDAGITSTGRPLDIDDRIGGMLHVIGAPGFPVIMTSLADDTAGAGFDPSGIPQTDTNGNGTSSGSAGQWNGILIDQYSHDRNVEIVSELEPIDLAAPGNNAVPDAAQVLGQLGPDEKSGDDNLRLGFVVVGALNEPTDRDVYSFKAQTGTEVWLDVDRTTMALDAVLELIDADGNVIARSVNSAAETVAGDVDFHDPALIADNHVNVLQKSPYYETHVDGDAAKDHWSTNPRDPGMRVVLPGGSGSINTYHVRVRSNPQPIGLIDDLDGGLTSGNYQLQVRLGETDEFAGSTVRYADIRFADVGIEVRGMPTHSPLTGEATEVAGDEWFNPINDDWDDALELGNLLNTDRAALSVAGRMDYFSNNENPAYPEVDFYRFELNYDSAGGTLGDIPIVIDVDYADGIGRPDTNVALYQETYNFNLGVYERTLIYSGTDSNVSDDQPGPDQGADMDDLDRGSAGTSDPYIGPILLPANDLIDTAYYLAISSNNAISTQLLQYQVPNPPNPGVRVGPISEVDTVATTADFDLSANTVPYHLGDVVMFVSRSNGNNSSSLYAVDPFTGDREAYVGNFQHTEDLAMRPDGQMYGYSVFDGSPNATRDSNNDDFLQIDPGAANSGALHTQEGDHGIVTRESNGSGGTQVSHAVGNARIGDGMQINALAFGAASTDSDVLRLVGVGERRLAEPNQAYRPLVREYDNILYQFDPTSGAAFSAPQDNYNGDTLGITTGTAVRERGILDTAYWDRGVDSENSLTVPVATRFVGGTTKFVLEDYDVTGIDQVTVEHDNGYDGLFATTYDIRINTGPELTLSELGPNNGIRDRYSFWLDDNGIEDHPTLPADGIPDWEFQFETGPVIVVNSNDAITDGDWFEITDDTFAAQTIRFEFDDDMLDGRVGNNVGDGIAVTSGVPIVFNSVMTRREVATQIVTAINQLTDAQLQVNAETQDHRITLIGDDGDGTIAATLPTNAGWSSFSIGIEGDYTDDGFKGGVIAPNFVVIPIEETDDTVAIGTAIETVVNNTFTWGATLPASAPATWTGPNDFSGAEGHRVNFPWARGDNTAFPAFDSAAFSDATTGDGLTTGRNEHQVLTLTGAPTGGTFELSYQGDTTGAIAYDAPDWSVEFAIQGLTGIGFGSVTVTGSGPGGTAPFDIEFAGSSNFDELKIDTSGLTGDGDEGGDVATLLNGSPVVASGRLDTTDPTIPASALDPMIVNIAAGFSETEVRNAMVSAINHQVSLANGAVDDAAAVAQSSPDRVELTGTWFRFDVAGTHDLEDGGPLYIIREASVSDPLFPGSNEEQRIQFNWDPNADPVESPPTGGVFDMTVFRPAALGGGTVVLTLPWNATNIDVLNAFDTAIGVGNVSVTGGALPANPIQVEFVGAWGNRNISVMTVNPGALTGGSGFTLSVNTLIDGVAGSVNYDFYGVGPGYDLAHPPEPPVTTTELPSVNDTKVTGLAFVNERLWAVDDGGGFYEVVTSFGSNFDPNSTTNRLEYVTSSAADLMGIQFASLERGPRNVESTGLGWTEGPYADLLFGIDVNGNIYAFNLQGELQPIFQDGSAMISTGISGVQGLAFSNLDVNLWHNTDNGMYFGFDRGDDNAPRPVDGIWDGFDWTTGEDHRIFDPNQYGSFNTNTYDFPGGAQGSIETDTFSLKGYSAEDQPYLYVDYFLDTENATSGVSPWYMRDAFRVFVAQDDGIWRPLATNNSSTFDELFDGFDVDVQEFYDIGDGGAPDSARQARIPLEAFAGLDNLRLRIDFSTAGEFDVSDPDTAGDELRGVQGWSIQDGDVFSIDGQIFEFDTDLTIAAPSGRKLADGQWFTLRDEGGTEVGFEFEDTDVAATGITRDVQIDFDDSMSAAEVAAAIFTAISGATQIDVDMYRNGSLPNDGHLINIVNQTFDAEYELVYTLDPTLPVDFLLGSDGATAGNVAVEIDRSMSDIEVADAIRTAVAATFNVAGQTTDTSVVKQSDEIVRIIGRSVDVAGPLGWTRRLVDDDPAEIEPGLQGDQYGAFEQGHDTPDFLRGRDNNQQGVRITNMTVGLAERGELVGGATTNDNNATEFGAHPQGSSSTYQGTYQIEIRRAASPIDPYGSSFLFDRTWNSNDRLAEQITLVAPAGYDIHDAQTFTVSDGVDTITFEYEDLELGAGHVTQGITFPGLSEDGGRRPDPIAAAGPNDLVAMVNTQIGLFDKAGPEIDSAELDVFFEDVIADPITPWGSFDPWATFDRYQDQYIVMAEEVEFGYWNENLTGTQDRRGGYGADEANLLIGVSKTDNPTDLDLTVGDTDDWWFYSIPAVYDFGGGLAWIDYPKIAADEDSVYITGNYFRFGDHEFQGVLVTRMDRLPSGELDLTSRVDVEASGAFTLQPAQSVDRLAEAPQLFVESYSEQGLRVWEMDDVNNLTIVASMDAPYQEYNFAADDVPQPDTLNELDTVGSRLMNAVWRDDSLWTAHTVNVADEAKVRWYEIITSGYTYDLVQQGDVNPGPGIDTFMPAIGVDAAGNVGITYTQSSEAIYPTMMISGRDADAPLGYTDPGVPVAVSETAYYPSGNWGGTERWGDYGGLALDPSDDATFWAFHETAGSINTWTTWWTSFTIENTSTSVAGDIGVTQGHVPVPFRAEMTDDQVAEAIAAAINSPSTQSILDVRAGMADGPVPELTETERTSNLINLYGTAAADGTGSRDFGEVIDDNARILQVQGNDDVIAFGDDTPSRYDLGDENVHREQGQVMIHSNVVSHSESYGIVVDAGVRQTIRGPYDTNPHPYFDTNPMPHMGSTRYLREINSENLAPGVVVANNIAAFNTQGGIRVSGDGAGGPDAPLPFGRVVNNTVYGNRQGDAGIVVDQNASPTLLNNVVANLQTGISVDATSLTTILGANLYHDTNNRTAGLGGSLGDFPIDSTGSPLFIDPATGNFYPAPLSQVIDSSLSSLDDRTAFVSVKDPLGLDPSPIIAPKLDVTGQLRADDRDVDTPSGQGDNVSIDRGAMDRADFTGPVAELLNPIDNDSEGRDIDPNQTVVYLNERELGDFTVLLNDYSGSGINTATIVDDAITLTQDGVLLEEGVDYTLGYNASNNELRFTPLSEIWEPDRVYVITLNNKDRLVLEASYGSSVSDGQQFTITNSTDDLITFEYESGYSVNVPQTFTLSVPVAGALPGGIADGDTFEIDPDGVAGPTLPTVFEFDNNSNSDPANVVITFTSDDAQDQISQLVTNAIAASGLGLSPKYLGDGEVHVGSTRGFEVTILAGNLAVAGIDYAVEDGQTFVIENGPNAVVFEFEDTAIADGLESGGAIQIDFSPPDTYEEIADNIAQAIRTNATVDLPVTQHLGHGFIHLDGLQRADDGSTGHLLDIAPTANLLNPSNLTQTGTPGVQGGLDLLVPSRAIVFDVPANGAADINDNETFVLGDDVSPPLRFEFDTNGSGLSLGNDVLIMLAGTETQDDVANLLVAEFTTRFPALNVVNVGGRVHLGGSDNYVHNSAGVANMDSNYRAGVADGEMFTISLGTTTVTFEFNNDGVTIPTTQNINFDPVIVDPSDPASVAAKVDELANDIVAVIQSITSLGLSPTYEGNGIIDLNETFNHKVDTTATNLGSRGVGGGAVAVKFIPDVSFTPVHMAASLIVGINGSEVGMTASARGGGTVFVNGASDAVDPVDIDFFRVQAIRDQAGNTLRENQPDQETRFTIILGDVGIDYGDNPEAGNNYHTELDSNGVRHALLVTDPLHLGSHVDAEQDGQPTIAADGDDSDHNVDVSGVVGSISMAPLAEMFTFKAPDALGITDTSTLTVADGDGGSVTFTFDKDGGGGFADPIVYYANATPESEQIIARKIVRAVQTKIDDGTLSGITVLNLGNAVFHIAGDSDDLVAASVSAGGTGLVQSDQLPLALELVAVPAETETLTIRDGSSAPVVLEFDTDSTVTGNNVPVTLGVDADTTAAGLATAIQVEIDAGRLTGITSAYGGMGSARVELNTASGGQEDDEDGVTFNSVLAKGFATPITVTSSDIGLLDAWVDWNRDGDFNDANEQVFQFQPLIAGDNPLTITTPASVPDSVIPFDTYARFRVSRSGGLGPDGLAIGGEVEDYVVRVMTNTAPTVANPLSGFDPLDNLVGGHIIEDPGASTIIDLEDVNGTNFSVFADVDIPNGNGDFLTYSVSFDLAGSTDPLPLDASIAGSVLTLDYPPNANGVAVLLITATDQAGATATDTLTVTVDAVNDEPEFTPEFTPGAHVTIDEDAGLHAVAGWATGIGPGPMTAVDEATQVLAFDLTPGATIGNIAFDSAPAIDPATGDLTFEVTGDTNGEAVFNVVLRDDGGVLNGGDDRTDGYDLTITVNAINDDPVVTVPPSPQSTNEDTTLVFSAGTGNPITVVDVDADEGTGELKVTLSGPSGDPIQNGTLTLTTIPGGLIFEEPGPGETPGTADTKMVFRGTETDINTALNGLQFEPTPDFGGSIVLEVTANDQGHSGGGPSAGGVDITRAITILVNPVNDQPTVDVSALSDPADRRVNEDTNLALPGIVVGDPDNTPSWPVTLRVTLDATHGGITVNAFVPGGLSTGDISGNGSGTVVLTGTADRINSTLAFADGVVYLPDPDFNDLHAGERIQVTVDDQGAIGLGGPLQAIDFLPISVLAVNDAPEIAAPAWKFGIEDDPAFYIPMMVRDVDADEGGVLPPLTVTLTLADATGTPTTSAGVLHVRDDVTGGLDVADINDNGTAVVTLSGSPTEITATLADAQGLRFEPVANSSGVFSLIARVDDGGNTGETAPPGFLEDVHTLGLTVQAVNDAPEVTVPAGPHAIDEGLDASLAVTGISLADVDAGDATPGRVVVTLSIPAGQGTLTVTPDVGVPASRITDNGSESVTLIGTVAEVNATLADAAGVTYEVPGEDFNSNIAGGNVIVTVAADDQGNTGTGGPQADSETVAITVTPVNDDPQITVPGAQNLAEGDLASLAIGGISVSDVDFEETATPDMVFTLSIPAGQGTLNVDTGVVGGVQVGDILGDGTREIQLTGTVAEINATLADPMGVTYTVPNGEFNELNNGGPVVLTATTKDDGNTGAGGGLDVQATIDITVHAINDDPTLVVPGPQVINEDYNDGADPPLTFDAGTATEVSVADVDVGEAPLLVPAGVPELLVTLQAFNGTLTLNDLPNPPGLTGLTFVYGDGDADASMQFTGTAADINAALDGMEFQPDEHFNTQALVQVTVNDQGNTGAGASQNGANITENIPIAVTAINDAPRIELQGALPDALEDTARSITQIQINDPDVDETPGGELVVTMSVTNGTLELDEDVPAGLVADDISGNETGSVIVTVQGIGSLTAIERLNNTLVEPGGFVFLGDPEFSGNAVLTITADDQGATGFGGVKTDTLVRTITVDPLNDAPTVTLPGNQTMDEDTSLTISGISIGDVDAAPGEVVATFSVPAGVGSLAVNDSVSGGVPFGRIDGNNSNSLELTGTVAEINATLADATGLTFGPAQDENGVVQLVASVNDQGNTGDPGPQTTNDTMTVTIRAINDSPVVTLPSVAQDAEEDTSFVFSTADGNAVSVEDVDADEGDGDVRTILSVNDGTLTVNTNVGGGVTDPTKILGNGSSSITLVGTPTEISTTLGVGLTYVGDQHFNGADVLVVNANDRGNYELAGVPLSDQKEVTINVAPVNDPPIAVSDEATTAEDTPLIVAGTVLTGNDQPGPDAPIGTLDDETGQALTLTGVSATSDEGGTVTLAGGIVTYTPAAHFNGQDTFTYTVEDDGTPNTTEVGTVTVTVTEVNDAPEPVDDAGATEEERPTTFFASVLVGNDAPGPAAATDEVGQTRTLTSTDYFSAEGGTIIWSPTSGLVVYTPAENFNGTDTFTYRVEDNGRTNGASDHRDAVGTVSIDVAAVNDAPVIAGPSDASVDEDTPQAITGLSVSDLDVHEASGTGNLTVTLVVSDGWLTVNDSVAGGVTVVPGNGSDSVTLSGTPAQINATLADPAGLVYQGESDFNGQDLLVVRVNDAGQTGAPGPLQDDHTVTLTVNPMNDAPVVTPALTQQTVKEDGNPDLILTSIEITDTDESETQGAEFVVIVAADNGTLDVSTSVENGLTWADIEGNGGSEVTLTGPLTAINTTLMDALGVFYRPNPDFNGQDTVTVTANDQGNTGQPPTPEEGSATVAITVTPDNDAPVAINDPSPGDPALSVSEDDVLNVAGQGVLDNDSDIDGDDLDVHDDDTTPGDGTYEVTSTRGVLVEIDVEDGTFIYDPTDVGVFQELGSGETLTDTFTYAATDGQETSNDATVTVTVIGENDVPVAVDDQYSVDDNAVLDTAAAGLSDVLGNDTDAENDPLEVVASDAESVLGATVVMQPNGDFVYDPTSSATLRALQIGDPPLVDTFTYTMADDDPGTNSTSIGTVTVTVNGANSAPIAVSDQFQTSEDEVLTVAASGVLANDSDDDSQQFAVVAQTLTSQLGGEVELFEDGSFTYDPSQSAQIRAMDAGQSLDDRFSYTVIDDEQTGVATATVIVTVNGITDNPYQNPVEAADVNGDGQVSPIDALIVINYLNSDAPAVIPPGTPAPPYLDADDNGVVSSNDVLVVILELNNIAAGLGGGEGESSDSIVVQPSLPAGGTHDAEIVSAGVSEVDRLALDTAALPMDPSGRSHGTDLVSADRSRAASDLEGSPWGVIDRSIGADFRAAFDDLATDSWALEETLDDIADEIGELNGPRSAADEIFGGVFA